ncbi:hypothetical protein D3C71_1869410 [compost metagenome]
MHDNLAGSFEFHHGWPRALDRLHIACGRQGDVLFRDVVAGDGGCADHQLDTQDRRPGAGAAGIHPGAVEHWLDGGNRRRARGQVAGHP